KVAIYCRVSTQEQTTENQKLRLEEYAQRNSWEYQIYEEQESSRKTRPIKALVLNKLRAREFDGVLIWKLDRWARSSQELIIEINELYEKGIKFISLSDNIDLSTATGKLQFQILSAFAEFERNLISERTKEGLYRARKQGKQLGRRQGSKDKTARKKGGYYLRYMKKDLPN
ncbi:MAG: recombinase family protein, partial [Candidatus Woesearchaeota archaeon]|nr:recombinase family protein [Candidatus Woesearchaeota archaeon]